MVAKKKECINCIYWHSTGREPYQGGCIVSINCINSENRPRFTPRDKVDPISEIKLRQGGKYEIKETSIMSDEDFIKAQQSKKRQNPIHPDVRQLTDESKQLMRKRRK